MLLALNLFFLQSYLIRFHLGTYPTNLQEILIALQICAFLYATPFKQILKALSKHWILWSFAIMTLISVLTVPIENRLDFLRHGKFLFSALILSFIFIETFREKIERDAAIRIMGIGALIFGIASLFYNLLGYNITHDNRLLGPLDSAVYMAFYLTPFFIYFTIRFLENTKQKKDLLFAIMLGLLILATKSMGAIGASFIVLLIYTFKRSQIGILRKKITKIAIAIIGIIAVATIFYSKVLPAFQTNYSSLNERGEIWKTSMHILEDPKTLIFGAGFGQFQTKYQTNVEAAIGRPPLDYIVLQPHNIFLLFIMQYGSLGLIFITICIWLTIKRILKFQGHPTIEIIAAFMLLYFFIHGLIDTPIFKNDLLIMLVLLMEIALIEPPKVHSNPVTKAVKAE